MYLWAVDEQNNTLYIRDEAKDHFISFNLTTGKYLGDIPTALPGEIIQFIVPRPGVFAVAPVLNKSVLQNRNYLYWQNTHGDLLGSIAASPDIKLFGGHRVMYQYDGSVGYKRKTDTLFTLTERDYAPDWIFQIENKPQADPADPGSKTINIISLQKNFILCNLFVAGQKQIREQSGNQGRITTSTGKLYHLFIDKVNRKASYVSRMIADKIGQPVRPELLNSQPDGTLFYAFNAMQLKDMLAKSLAEKEFGTDFKNQLQDLDVQVNAGDNPILLVGQVKR
jgi:hypothetical protein